MTERQNDLPWMIITLEGRAGNDKYYYWGSWVKTSEGTVVMGRVPVENERDVAEPDTKPKE